MMLPLIHPLFMNKLPLSLPGIGVLKFEHSPAHIHPGGQQIESPSVNISFHKDQNTGVDPQQLVCVARFHACNENEAAKMIEASADELNKIPAASSMKIHGIGEFIRHQDGSLSFVANPLKSPGFPVFELNKVIRKDEIHTIRVGDQEKTNLDMQDQLSQTLPVQNIKWLIIAGILFLIALSIILYSQLQPKGPGYFRSGNGATIELLNPLPSYQSQP